MNNTEFIGKLPEVSKVIKTIELAFVILYTFFIYIKISGQKTIEIKSKILMALSSISISFIAINVERKFNLYYSWFTIIFLLSTINKLILKNEISYVINLTIISYCSSYVIFVLSVMIAFFPSMIIKTTNDYLGLLIILLIYTFLVYKILRIKKLKHGMLFLKKRLEDINFSIMILNIGCLTLFSYSILKGYADKGSGKLGVVCTVISIIMFITIRQSFDLYYKQSLLTRDLEETKRELETKKNEIEKLEKENLEFSKTSHSLAHKQKALEFKLEKLLKEHPNSDCKESIKREIDNLNKEVYKEPEKVELAKTGIESIDNMLSYMQSECIKDNIKFELQVVGNIYYMINNLITENDLEILIADHIKDAIFAINFSDNSNRSILVRIGNIDNVYSLYIYDSGLEFEKDVLDNLGRKPITTHAGSGGTGMGFMNTFETLNKTKASLIINEIGKPCEDNYTKVLIFKFDNKNEFKVNSYKDEILV